MGFGKNLAITAVLYALLNFIFAIIYYAAIEKNIGSLFSGGNPGLIIGAILVPYGEPIVGTMGSIIGFSSNAAAASVSLLWILLPGILAASISSWKFADESPKTAFWSSALGIYLMIAIAIILHLFVGSITIDTIDGMLFWASASGVSDAIIYSALFVGYLLESFFYAGFGAMSSSSF